VKTSADVSYCSVYAGEHGLNRNTLYRSVSLSMVSFPREVQSVLTLASSLRVFGVGQCDPFCTSSLLSTPNLFVLLRLDNSTFQFSLQQPRGIVRHSHRATIEAGTASSVFQSPGKLKIGTGRFHDGHKYSAVCLSCLHCCGSQ